jgi:hypothetical protein
MEPPQPLHLRKDFPLTDATSFVVMERLRIPYAFTFERHFVQCGLQSIPSIPALIIIGEVTVLRPWPLRAVCSSKSVCENVSQAGLSLRSIR